MKRFKQRALQDVAKEVLAEPYIPRESKARSYLEHWLDPFQRGGMLRGMSESYFIGSLHGHSVDDVEQYLQQFISDARESGTEIAAKRLYLKLMPPKPSDGGSPSID